MEVIRRNQETARLRVGGATALDGEGGPIRLERGRERARDLKEEVTSSNFGGLAQRPLGAGESNGDNSFATGLV